MLDMSEENYDAAALSDEQLINDWKFVSNLWSAEAESAGPNFAEGSHEELIFNLGLDISAELRVRNLCRHCTGDFAAYIDAYLTTIQLQPPVAETPEVAEEVNETNDSEVIETKDFTSVIPEAPEGYTTIYIPSGVEYTVSFGTFEGQKKTRNFEDATLKVGK